MLYNDIFIIIIIIGSLHISDFFAEAWLGYWAKLTKYPARGASLLLHLSEFLSERSAAVDNINVG